MIKSQPSVSAAALKKGPDEAALGKDNVLSLFESLVGPSALVFSLWGVAYYYEGMVPPAYLLLSIMVFALTFPGQARLQVSVLAMAIDIILNWAWVAALLLVAGIATAYSREFSKSGLLVWIWAAPLSEFVSYLLLRAAAPLLLEMQGPKERAIIVGMNEQGIALARKLNGSAYSRISFVGYVDGREVQRIDDPAPHKMLGNLNQLASVVQKHQIQVIYLSLPMASQPRILKILDDLKDTTASIYFVPDMFVTDLIQGNTSAVCGMPVISVCETPFRGGDGALKRVSDIVLSTVILALVSPIMVAVALAVKFTSPGPIIFKQRRYGLDGEKILVYKFRSMTVTEDGGHVRQATKNDQRITPLGAFLRKTSLDELPQFINVLQGRMSIVGPRPHAVSHNEMYRKLIKGYMVRHKVKPGITGWAQVNGYRGETDTLDKMKGRIDYDLDYLRNWSLRLDIHIILKTIRLVIKDQKAY